MAQAPTVGKSPVNKNRLAKPPVVDLPETEEETVRPKMGRLTAVMVACFSVGVAWPIFGGLDFVQRPPGSTPKSAGPEAIARDSEPAASGTLATPGETPALRVAPLLTTTEAVRIESQQVASCQGDGGEAVARCDEPNLEGVIDARLARLAACDAAADAAGVLSLGVYLDFASGRITRVQAGASTTLPKAKARALLACAEETVAGTPLDDVEHEHARYWVYYLVRFLPPGSPFDAASAPPAREIVSASGQATIGGSTAVVRNDPSPRASVATRLPYGTRVNVTGRAGDWYRIERGGTSLGWLHRKAVGM